MVSKSLFITLKHHFLEIDEIQNLVAGKAKMLHTPKNVWTRYDMHRHLIVPTANCKNVIPYVVNLLTMVHINEFHYCKESKEQKAVNYDGIVAPVSERHFSQSANKTLMVKASFPMLSIPCILHNDIAAGIYDRSTLVPAIFSPTSVSRDRESRPFFSARLRETTRPG